MHRFLRLLPAAALLTAAPLVACSGDDDDDDTPVTSVAPEGTATTPDSPDNTGPATSGNDSTEAEDEPAPGVATTTG